MILSMIKYAAQAVEFGFLAHPVPGGGAHPKATQRVPALRTTTRTPPS
jgi:hypothetical protein